MAKISIFYAETFLVLLLVKRLLTFQEGAFNFHNISLSESKCIGSHCSPICKFPTEFPRHISLHQEEYENWSQEIRVEAVLTAVPRSPEDIVTVVNWAWTNGYKIKAQGYKHSWSPLTLTHDTKPCSRIILLDTTKYLTKMSMLDESTVKVQSGASLEAVLTFLQSFDRSLQSFPALGDVTIGGILAVGGHGTGVPLNEMENLNHSQFGSVSNSVTSLTAVVWDTFTQKYALKEFKRGVDKHMEALMLSLGRIIITEATLQTRPAYKLRCQSIVDIPAVEVFAQPEIENGQNTLGSMVNRFGRLEVIWYLFTKYPWIKVWNESPLKPKTAREVRGPYNYPFTQNIPLPVANLIAGMTSGAWWITPAASNAGFTAIKSGLISTHSMDLWGNAKDLLLYVESTTLRTTKQGLAVLTRRNQLQATIFKIINYVVKAKAYEKSGFYPINNPVEIRVGGLDLPLTGPDDVPNLSPTKAKALQRNFDIVIWFDLLSFPRTPKMTEFMSDIESFCLTTLNDGLHTRCSHEWSKGWGYTKSEPYSNQTVFKILPDLFGKSDYWETIHQLNQLDPHFVFMNELLNQIFRH